MAVGDVAAVYKTTDARAGAWFDGTDDYVDLGDNLDLDGDAKFSVSCWVRTTDTNGEIIAKSTGAAPLWRVQLSSGKPLVRLNDGVNNLSAITPATTVNDGDWHHICATGDLNGNLIIYVDKVAEATTNIAAMGDCSTSGSLVIGRFGDASSNYFGGTISNIKFWNRDLTAAEVGKLFDGTDGIVNGLTHQWLMTDDYNDNIGSVNGTNYGSLRRIYDEEVASALNALRGSANDHFLLSDGPEGQVLMVRIVEA